MIETSEEIKETVYLHLHEMYGKIAMELFPCLTKELAGVISATAYQEMIQMAQDGNLKNYYERIKKNAI